MPQKYPGKRAFKGPRAGQLSGHPLGKNPGDVWIIPNVKANHVERTAHPCQFPVDLVERLVADRAGRAGAGSGVGHGGGGAARAQGRRRGDPA